MMTRSQTLTTFPIPTRAAMVAVLLLAIGRGFFLVWPRAFDPYPETQAEYHFYQQDLTVAARRPEAQILVQGTSRLKFVNRVPLFEKRWHTRDRTVNVSQPLNTFWHMNLLHRRNPGLLDHADLWVIDVLPAQMRVAWGFTEHDALFLRESTLAERVRIRSPWSRARAVFDWMIPMESHRHSPANWCRALAGLYDGPEARLAKLNEIKPARLPDITGQRGDLTNDPAVLTKMFAEVLYTPGKPESRVQTFALRELLGRRPEKTHVLLFHPPVRADFAAKVAELGATEVTADMRRTAESVATDHVHVAWFDSPDELDLKDADFGPDGVHVSLDGNAKYERYLAQQYRAWIPQQTHER